MHVFTMRFTMYMNFRLLYTITKQTLALDLDVIKVQLP